MQEYILKIKNFTKQILRPKKINPHDHWKILLRIFLGVVGILILFSLYLLFQIKNEQIFQIEAKHDDNSVIINQTLLQKVTESFNQKEAMEKEIRGGERRYKDPSVR